MGLRAIVTVPYLHADSVMLSSDLSWCNYMFGYTENTPEGFP